MNRPGLSKADEAEISGYLEELLSLHPVLGIGAFRRAETVSPVRRILWAESCLKAKECDAEGFQTNTEFAVPAGSLVRGWTVPSMKKSPGFFNRRTRYTADGVIMVSSDDRLRFVADHELSHSRQAEINSMASLQVFSTV